MDPGSSPAGARVWQAGEATLDGVVASLLAMASGGRSWGATGRGQALLIVAGLADPSWTVEIEAIAAK